MWPVGQRSFGSPLRGGAGLQLDLAKCKANYAHTGSSIPPLTYILKKIRYVCLWKENVTLRYNCGFIVVTFLSNAIIEISPSCFILLNPCICGLLPEAFPGWVARQKSERKNAKNDPYAP